MRVWRCPFLHSFLKIHSPCKDENGCLRENYFLCQMAIYSIFFSTCFLPRYSPGPPWVKRVSTCAVSKARSLRMIDWCRGDLAVREAFSYWTCLALCVEWSSVLRPWGNTPWIRAAARLAVAAAGRSSFCLHFHHEHQDISTLRRDQLA